MKDFSPILLELVRPGERHGQLLSRLTNYIALCDGVNADTIRFGFDHHELLDDISALRYTVGRGSQAVPNDLRRGAVRRVGDSIAALLSQMEGFQTRYAEASRQADRIHLRLVLGGSELSLVPFEFTSTPPGFRPTGELLLQSRTPTVLTRETRDAGQRPLRWNRRPRILLCSADLEGYAEPPLLAHATAIGEAIQPWVDGGYENNRPLSVDAVVTVLKNASLDDIRRAIEDSGDQPYTHIHILTHGCTIGGDDERWGIALRAHGTTNRASPTSAQELSQVLLCGPQCEWPTMVVLASCDGGNQGSVVAPGSSLAFDLQQAGVPWVIASQLPLTYRGSATLARIVYRSVIQGDDPRAMLLRLRQELFQRDPESHDWASIVAYGSFPPDFEAQLRAHRIKMVERLIESAFDRAMPRDPDKAEEVTFDLHHVDKATTAITKYLETWRETLPANVRGRNDRDWCEFIGKRGAVSRMHAHLLERVAENVSDTGHATKIREEQHGLMKSAMHDYREAAERQVGNHWVVIQFLCLRRLLEGANDEEADRLFQVASWSASLDWAPTNAPETRGWAAASLLELAILSPTGLVNAKDAPGWAREMKALVGPETFAFYSTVRHLKRYTEWWNTTTAGGRIQPMDPPIVQRAKDALDALVPSPSPTT